jgi:hypothetical protein
LNEQALNEEFTCEFYIDQIHRKDKIIEFDLNSTFSNKADIKFTDKIVNTIETQAKLEPVNQSKIETKVLPNITMDDKELNLENESNNHK